jgi:hypothetical protein
MLRVKDHAAKTLSGLTGDLTGMGVAAVASTTIGPAGAVLAPVIKAGVDEVLHRMLTARQKHRVRSVAEAAAERYQELLEEGERLRDDDFFDARDGRWSAGEVTEAVLLTAANEPEEMKIPYIGNLLANLAVRKSVDVPTAHWLITLAHELTWIQYVQLALIQEAHLQDSAMTLLDVEVGDERPDLAITPDVEVGDEGPDWPSTVSMTQLSDLGFGKRELILPRRDESSLFNFSLRNHRLTSQGMLFWTALRLFEIPKPLQSEQATILSRCGGYALSNHLEQVIEDVARSVIGKVTASMKAETS